MEDSSFVMPELTALLKQFETVVREGKRLPWTGRVLVDEAQLLTLVEHVRHLLPEEVRQAHWVIQERDRILETAAREAEEMMADARQRAAMLAEESKVLQAARQRADEILEQAQERAREMHQGAKAYADDILAGLQTRLNQLIASIEANRGELRR